MHPVIAEDIGLLFNYAVLIRCISHFRIVESRLLIIDQDARVTVPRLGCKAVAFLEDELLYVHKVFHKFKIVRDIFSQSVLGDHQAVLNP